MSARVLTEGEHARLRELLRERTGLDVAEERRADVERAVFSTLERCALPSVDDLCKRISAPGGADLLDDLVPALTINETHFFRSRPQMEVLDRHVLPALMARRRDVRRLRLWSAGCSTGEEAYTLAILADRHLGALRDWDVSVLGTDIDPEALARAREAVYRSWSFREVPVFARAAFELHDSELRVVERIRAMVSFRRLNLVEDRYAGIGGVDLLLCRNVLMYLDPDRMRQALTRLADAVTPGGWLVVAAAEVPLVAPAGFQARTLGGAILHEKVAAPAAPHPAPARRARPASRVTARSRRPAAAAEAPSREPLEALRRAKAHVARHELDLADRWLGVALHGRPHDPACHYLHGLVMHARGDLEGALEAQRRCLYAAPDFALAHVATAAVEAAIGEPERARRSLRRAGRTLASRPEEEPVPEGDGLTVGGLRELVDTQRRLLAQRMVAAHSGGTDE